MEGWDVRQIISFTRGTGKKAGTFIKDLHWIENRNDG